jgi:outer membrane protein assembly factor BamB
MVGLLWGCWEEFMRLRACVAVAGVVLMISGGAPALADDNDRPRDCEWSQWGQSAAHNGQVLCAGGDYDVRLLTRMVVDPFAGQLNAETGGGIPVHYPAPLTDGENVFVMRKGGTFVSCDPPGFPKPGCGLDPENLNRMTWSMHAFRWHRDRLVPMWTFTSDWKPTQLGSEAMFQSAMSGDFLYVPGAGGTVFQLSKRTGQVVRRINPFGHTIDPNTFVGGGLTVDDRGLFYNVIKLDGEDARSWLVRVTKHEITKVDYRALIPGVPTMCHDIFTWFIPENWPLPPPPQPDGSPTLPRQEPCLSLRAANNLAPAIGRDGTIYSVVRPHGVAGYAYGHLVALNPDLSLKWSTSLRGLFSDGCGVLVPYGNDFFNCRPGTPVGIDPITGLPPAVGIHDRSSASVVVLPDGGVLYGGHNVYNGFRGHMVKLDRNGRYQANYHFGWDVTPAIYRHGDTYSILTKDNHYLANGPFNISSLDANLRREWSYTSTETRTCERGPDGIVRCIDDGQHPQGFEFCISAPAVDRDGNVYGISADGNLYIVDRQGRARAKVFLAKTVFSAYTPVSLDSRGRIYAQNNGELYVLGR